MDERALRGRCQPLRHVALVVDDAPVGLVPPQGTHLALVYVDGQAIRWTFSGDGTDPDRPPPTRTFGVRTLAGETLQLLGTIELTLWRAVAAQAANATLQVMFARLIGRSARGPF